jgi:hypothetical protein
MSARILGWRVSSFLACPRVGELGARAGTSHRVGGGPGGASVHGAPYVTSCTVRDNHSHGNVARWMTRALQTASVVPSRKDVEKYYCALSTKSNATGFCLKNEHP